MKLLIITATFLLSYFQDYVTFKERQGCEVYTATTEHIYSRPGTGKQAKVKEYIRHFYNDGGRYVILAGNDTMIPAGRLYVEYPPISDSIPADIYYADLNEDNLSLEVAVGRWCVWTAEQVKSITEKLITYQQDTAMTSTLLLAGELMIQPNVYGDECMKVIDTIFPMSLKKIRLYDGDRHWTQADAINTINDSGINISNHLGHSGLGNMMKMSYHNCNDFSNSPACFIYTQGCNCGGFDGKVWDGHQYVYKPEQCVAMRFHNAQNCCHSIIANSRQGLYAIGGLNGSSQRLNIAFWHQVLDKGVNRTGDALNLSKETFMFEARINPSIRFAIFETNLLGDPTMELIHYRNYFDSYEVNMSDALLVLRHYIGLIQLKGDNLTAADVDGNGVINAGDAFLIAKYFTKLIDKFPAGDWFKYKQFDFIKFNKHKGDIKCVINFAK